MLAPNPPHPNPPDPQAIELKDKFENIGASLVKQVASATNDVAGDGAWAADGWRLPACCGGTLHAYSTRLPRWAGASSQLSPAAVLSPSRPIPARAVLLPCS